MDHAAAGVDDLIAYVRRDQNLADLTFKDDNARRLACQNIGAAYAPEYEKKITDTGWLECGGENAGTLWARQIGNMPARRPAQRTGRKARGFQRRFPKLFFFFFFLFRL